MKPVFSQIDHDPDNGLYGDCFRAVIASLLEIEEAEKVPHFCENGEADALGAVEAASKFCFERIGCVYRELPLEGHLPLEGLLAVGKSYLRDTHYVVLGRTAIANHCVIALNDKIVHDPTYGEYHGIIGPSINEEGGEYWWIGMLVRP